MTKTKKLKHKPELYEPMKIHANHVFSQFTFENCELKPHCYEVKDGIHTPYDHDSIAKLLPHYKGILSTYLSLIFGNGLKTENENNQKYLSLQSSSGDLNYEHIYNWVKEYVELNASLLFVDNDYIEHLAKCKIYKVLTFNINDSESWANDFGGVIIELSDEEAYKSNGYNLSKEDEKQLIINNKYVRIDKSNYWFIPSKNLVLLGNLEELRNKTSSIFSTDRSRIQYILESLRLANDIQARDKAPAIILWIKAFETINDLANSVGVNPELVNTDEGKIEFDKQLKQKFAESKAEISKIVVQDSSSKIIYVSGNVYEKVEPVQMVNSYIEDLKIIDSMSISVVAGLFGLPVTLFDQQNGNFATGTKPQLQFTQDTLIKEKQYYINVKLEELKTKSSLNYLFQIDEKSFVDSKEIAEIEKLQFENSKLAIENGIPHAQVIDYLNLKTGNEFKSTNPDLVLFSSSLNDISQSI